MRICLIIALLLSFLLSQGQEKLPLQFEQINGLSQNTVYSIMKDRKGFLWIATGNGLNRYDGVEMKIFKPSFGAGNGQMHGRIIRSDLIEDDNENIWFSTDITLHCFNKKTGKFTSFYVDKHLNIYTDASKGNGLFANVLLVKDSLVWMANSSGGLYSLNRFTMAVKRFPIIHTDEAGNTINIMYNGVYDGNDKFWFATKKGVFSFRISSGKWHQHLKEYPFYSVTINKDTLYACWEKEIFIINTRDFSFSKSTFQKQKQSTLYKAHGFLRRLYKDEFGQIWAGDENGNILLKKPGSIFFEWQGNINGSAQPETNFPVYCIFNFDNQHLWVGGDVLGLQKANISNSPFYSYPAITNSTGSKTKLFIHSIYEDNSGKVWLGSFQRGIFILDKKNNSVKEVNLPYKGSKAYYNKSVPLIKSDSKGNLWTSMSGHLFIRQAGAKNFIPLKIPVPSNSLQEPQMWSMTEYNNGWLIGTNIGFYFITQNDEEYTISHLSHLGNARMTEAWVHPDGSLWLAPQTGGIWIIKDLNKSEKPKKIFEETNIRSFHYERSHRLLWIGSASGLIAYHLPDGKYKIYREEDGLHNSFIYGIVPDAGNLWISTNNGLSKAELNFSSNQIFPTVRVTNFTTGNGLPANEFNTGAFFKGNSGYLYFGSVNGVTWFLPSAVKSNQDTPIIRVVQVFVNDENADSSLAPEYIKQLVLPWHKNNLYLRFRGIDYNSPDEVKYMYRLEGWDKDWVYSNNLNEVRYNKLPPNKYVFKVKAANQSGIWNETPYEITVIINPPFWKTWWFYSLVFLAFITTTVFFTRMLAQRKLKQRIAELEKQRVLDKERQRISREMHDDIGAGLTQIVLMSESAKIKSKVDNKELSDIADTSRMLVSNMGEIIWSLNPENKTLDQLLSYLREHLNKQLEYSGMNYFVEVQDVDKNILLSNEQMRNILLVAKETVNNSIKHSQAKNISIDILYHSGILKIKVADDGIGFDTQKKFTGNGLRNIRQRTEEIEGEIKIESVAGKGCQVIFTFPIILLK